MLSFNLMLSLETLGKSLLFLMELGGALEGGKNDKKAKIQGGLLRGREQDMSFLAVFLVIHYV